jgi:membrane associated rhomboid family serine protease
MSLQPDPVDLPPPPRRREPVFNLPPATMWLAVALIVAFAVERLLPGRAWQWFFSHFAFISVVFWPPGAALPRPAALHSLVTYAFLHGDLMHLGVNLGFLLAFGSFVERSFGTLSFLAIFVISSVAAALTEFFLRSAELQALIGASGAVYGMTGAAVFLMFLVGRPGQRRGLLIFVLVLMGLNLLMGLTGLGDLLAGARIGWKAHAAGFVAGLLLAPVLSLLPARRT